MMTGYKRRELTRQLADALASLPVVIVTGLRQAGKTTLLQNEAVVSRRKFYTLDDFAVLEAAQRDPDALLAGSEPVTIDEAQRCPELMLAVKCSVDRHRTPGRVLLSGSANFALLRSVSETLAGRAVYLSLCPFTRRERKGSTRSTPFIIRVLEGADMPRRVEQDPLSEAEVLAGGIPPVALGEAKRPALWFAGYEQTYLERDVRQLSQVADLVTFRNFIHLCALRTSQVLNQSSLGRDAKLTAATTARYLNLLETSYVLRRLPPYLRSRVSRLIKSPKILVSDSGLASYLTGVRGLQLDTEEPLRGALFETYVAQNLEAILGAYRPDAEVCFWNIQGRSEVDFVVSTARQHVAIEVKAATRFSDADLAGLRAFAAHTPRVRALILAYNGTEAVSLGDRLWAIPLATLLS